MSIAFVLGNGTSRQGLVLDNLKKHGAIYGCNALYRDYTPDVLVATDKPIAEHIQNIGYAKTNKFYTRRPAADSGALTVPKPYFGFSSGPIAVALAAMEQHRKIYLIGFDVGPSADKKFNNMYADSEFYKTSGSAPTYTGNWVKQLQKVCSDFNETKFIRVTGKNTARLSELDGIKNMVHLPIAQFNEQLNT
jgi:hypothetical protein